MNALLNALLVSAVLLFPCKQTAGQVPELKKYLDLHSEWKAKVSSFYEKRNFEAAWISTSPGNPLAALAAELENAESLGLNEEEYDRDFVSRLRTGRWVMKDKDDSLEAEIKLTSIAMAFYHDILYGNKAPAIGYMGLTFRQDNEEVAEWLTAHLRQGASRSLAEDIDHRLPEIGVLTERLQRIWSIISSPGFADIIVVQKNNDLLNKPLLGRLVQTGIINDAAAVKTNAELKNIVRQSQQEYGLLSDGIIRSTYLEALNLPLRRRINQLKLAVNNYRWLLSCPQPTVAVVNIPAAYMKVYRNGKVLLEMRMVTGKPSTPTPTLTSMINEIVLYPYWHVPRSIATRELLPLIRINPAFLDQGNYQVLDSKGRIVDPAKINWHSLNASNFPYLLRQSTGCDNALGILKLNFYSPYGVYLHDTPNKFAFALGRRFLSHGCMRMEKPFDMARLLLPENHMALDTLDEKGNLRNKAPVFVKADIAIPLVVWYTPAGTDINGKLVYYEDIYNEFR